MRKLGLLLASVMCSSASYAVINGSPVSQAEYQDFLVHINNSSGSCSGSLIGGQYLLTARHCIMPISGPNKDVITSYSLTIKQGVTRSTALSYERTFSMDSSFSSVNAAAVKDNTATEIYAAINGTYPLNGGVNPISWPYESDLVILKLNSPIPHTTGGILSPIYDPVTNITRLPKNTNFVMRGWGIMDEVSGQVADTMQKTTTQLFVDYKDAVNPIDFNDNKYGFIKTTCVDAPMAGCQWYRKDHTEFFSILDARLSEGDSGSAIYYNNQIFGVLSKTGTINVYNNYMSDLTLYVDALVPFFNKVLYPYSPGKHITNGDSSAHSIVVPVQNMTANDVLFTPVLNDSTGLFSADMSDCDGVIKSKEGCVINVTFNAVNQPITAIKSASIYLNGNVNIPLTVDFKSTSSSGGGDEVGGSGGGSGGSANGLMLLLLAVITLWRSGRNFSA